MSLSELSASYAFSAGLLRRRLRELRQMQETAQTSEEVFRIRRRILDLTPILTEMNELADLTAHYYDRGYWRSEKYTV